MSRLVLTALRTERGLHMAAARGSSGSDIRYFHVRRAKRANWGIVRIKRDERMEFSRLGGSLGEPSFCPRAGVMQK